MFYKKFCHIVCLSLFFTFNATIAFAETTTYTTIEWNDLLTQKDIDALMNPDDLGDIADGSEEDKIASALLNTLTLAANSDYQRALTSTVVRDEYDNKKVRIAGFVVPITVDNNQTVTSFFLVPYYGACIHMPPPPPNQIIYSTIDQEFKIDDLYAPYWIEGTMSTTLTENELATAAYSMRVDKVESYTE